MDGLYCRQCALLRKKLKEVWFTICEENEVFQDFLNTFESSNDNTNVVNAPQKLTVFNQDANKKFSQSPPHIDHHCCYRCGDSLYGIFCHQCTCESCGNGAYYGYNCPSKVSIISNPEPCHNQNVEMFLQTLPSSHRTCYFEDENSFAYDSTPNFVNDSPNVLNPPSQPLMDSHEFCGNDAHFSHNCPPQASFIYNLKPGPHETFQCQQVIFYEPCCENYGGPHETFQCQPMNYHEPNPCYDSNSSGFDIFQPSQSVIDHLNLQQRINYSMIELRETFQAWLQQVGNIDSYSPEPSQYWRIPIYYDDDDDEESSTPLRDIIISELPPDYKSFSDEDVPKKIYSNPLFDEKIISIKIDPHHFNAESDLIESLLNRDSSIISSSKIDSLLDEFAIELIFLKSIPPGIDEADCDPEEDIRLIKNLFDSLMEEIDLSLTLDDSMPSGIEHDDYDSEGDILILEELLSNDSLSLPENESFHFDIPSSPRPFAKPPDNDEVEPDSRSLTVKASSSMGDRVKLSELKQALRGISPDFEDSFSWFCPSITRSSHPQLHFGNPVSKSYR
nr:hypothetical protein [Tanacetum cinerariifolium]